MILLVEDSTAVRRVTAKMLERAGYRVLTAADAGEATAIASEHAGEIDLLLTDVVLPDVNGRELAEAVGRIRSGIRVLFASGYTADAVIRHGVGEREIDLIQKPFSALELARRVRSILDRS